MKSSGLTTIPSPPRPVSSSTSRSPSCCARRVGHVHDLVRRRQQQFRVGPADVGQRLHVPEVVLVDVDAALGGQQVERGQLQVGERARPASSTAGRRRRTGRCPARVCRQPPRRRRACPLVAVKSRGGLLQRGDGPWQRGLRRRPRRRRTGSCSSSWALADHGISSQSRQTHVVSSSSQKSGGGQCRPHAGRGTASPAPASLKNRRPVRV